jgi:hypothetical protein
VALSIELLAWSQCPSHDEAYVRLAAVLDELGRTDVAIDVRWVETEQEAAATGFVGSPTFRWRGRDLLPPDGSTPVGLACRVYRRRDGRASPLPDPDDLRESVRAALAQDTG